MIDYKDRTMGEMHTAHCTGVYFFFFRFLPVELGDENVLESKNGNLEADFKVTLLGPRCRSGYCMSEESWLLYVRGV